ncbi:hypothetical protein [Reyranella sp.]|uniref:hypothetical protein n=1 Tax=Reyranella sp. TaxID=1929291 RepID=UPI003BACD51F
MSEAIEKLTGPAMAEIRLIHQTSVFNNGTVADTFYTGRIGLNDPLAYYERQLLHEIDGLAPARAYHEIGGGIGLIPITLGLTGRRAVNIDNTRSRISHGARILESLSLDDATLPDRVQMVCASAPDVFDSLDTRGAYAISTNIGAVRSPEFVESFLKAVQARYSAFIFDVCLLFGIFRTAEEWDERLELLEFIWKQRPKLLFETGGPGRYYVVNFE